ncbi:hypothetical protein BGZ61DRAFT_191725 [Ilyonectria robusta]|uniref:uncharacterized protein n=1 Tax=Ilyonectria robusta TaxID=1079257 RepID=UPI001E8DD705|nr:uncharacterized protein BGZ61DRAFT_191725 [Ilyonectria robusta]KAH8655939.1 hypothetical protein BGZ61DRAFT_191725 [Ilyonectria robusta]
MTRKRVKEGRKWEEERGGGSRALCRGWALREAVLGLANQRPPLPTSSNVAPTYETGLHPSFTSSILSSIYLLKQQAIYPREPPRTKKSRHDICGTQKPRCQTLRGNSAAEGPGAKNHLSRYSRHPLHYPYKCVSSQWDWMVCSLVILLSCGRLLRTSHQPGAWMPQGTQSH